MQLFHMSLQPAIHQLFDIELHGFKIEAPESAILLLNHQSVFDYAVIAGLADMCGMQSNYYFFQRQICTQLPTFRLLWKHIQGKRGSPPAGRKIDSVFADFAAGIQTGPQWLVVFPEIEEFSPTLQRIHQNACYDAGAPVLRHLLYPSLDTVSLAVGYMRRCQTKAIYNITIHYQQADQDSNVTKPSFERFLATRQRIRVIVDVERIPLNKASKSTRRFERWLEKQWYKKDKKIEKLFLGGKLGH